VPSNIAEAVAERRELCVSLLRRGFSPPEIADQVGISDRRVRDHLRKAGVGDLRRERPTAIDCGPLHPVRLVDVPLETRLQAADELVEQGLLEREQAQAVLGAALWPSERVYWISGVSEAG
jgi:hypothetical protein